MAELISCAPTEVVYVDFSKALDYANHPCLHERLKCSEFCTATFAWFEGFLTVSQSLIKFFRIG